MGKFEEIYESVMNEDSKLTKSDVLKKGYYGSNGGTFQQDNGPGVERCYINKERKNRSGLEKTVYSFPEDDVKIKKVYSKYLGDGYREGKEELYIDIKDIPKEYLSDDAPRSGNVLWGTITWG